MVKDKKIESTSGRMWLAPYRVLDLTDEKGSLCSRILGDLGAEVIKIEPPGGSSERRQEPFHGNTPHPEKSLFWFAFNLNKKGITLDIEREDGQAILRRLVTKADFLVESFKPGYMESLGLGYNDLTRINKQIIVTSISPFGSTGPYSGMEASDISVMALGGYMSVCGDADRAPLRISYPQAYFHASASAAVGTLIAHYYRGLSGEGQHVDVSAQQAVAGLLMGAAQSWDLNQVVQPREGMFYTAPGGTALRQIVYQCKDGWVSMLLRGAPPGVPSVRALVDWMAEEGMASDFLKHFDWDKFEPGRMAGEEMDTITKEISNFFLSKSRAEICHEAVKRRVVLSPVATGKDIVESIQLDARKFWMKVEHPELGKSLTYVGTPFKSPQGERRRSHRAPLLGEHNTEVYQKELGLSRQQLALLKQAGVI